jgi:TonB family protein
MALENDHTIYNAAAIKRYLDGDMTPAEMYALEKAALDDPFLAEAIEGYQNMPAQEWQSALHDIKIAFATPIPDRKRETPAVVALQPRHRFPRWFKYAAAVLFTAGIAGILYKVNTQERAADKNIPIAKTDAQTTPPPTPTESPVATTQDSNKEMTIRTENLKDSITTTLSTGKPATAVITAAKSDTTTSLLASGEENYDRKKQQENIGYTFQHDMQPDRIPGQSAPPDAVTAPAPKIMAEEALQSKTPGLNMNNTSANRSGRYEVSNFYNQQNLNQQATVSNDLLVQPAPKPLEMNNKFNGVIVGSDNTPLSFANVNVKDQGFGTYADVNGRVRLVSTDSIINIEVKSLGYKSREVALSAKNNNNRIVLEEEAMPKTVQSIAISPKRMKAKNTAVPVSRRTILAMRDSTQEAEPEDGWDNYSTYLTNNFNLPEELVKKNVHGEVAVSFDVNPNGSISNITIDKSACTDCDALAKRLVEQGPQWKAKKGKKTKAKVNIRF